MLQSETRDWEWGTGSSGTPYPGKTYFFDRTAGQVRFLIDPSGNVGIGTASPQYLLSVNGTIGAQDVLVTNTGWSDYVFAPNYQLQPLSAVADYIQANHHLPEIPSESEVKEKGVSVSDMQAKLLAKIEELTLHLIRQEKENRDLRDRITRLEARREPAER